MKATMLAHDLILAGSADIVVAGGMESMSNAPYLLEKARGGKVSPEKIPLLKPAFRMDGAITAASASANAGGAAALVLMRRSEAERRGLAILAEIRRHATHSQDPAWYTTAPIRSIQKPLARLSRTVADVDLLEINGAFAVVLMAASRELGMNYAKLNVNDGACALGHPIGATGARRIVTLLHALQAKGQTRGIAFLCIGEGEATSIAIERPNA